MCPVCMAIAAMIAGSAAGGGGLTALTVGLFRRKTLTNRFPKPANDEEVHHGDEHGRSGSAESGIGQ
jgi:hypothetical protein